MTACRPGGQDIAPNPGAGDLLVQLGVQLRPSSPVSCPAASAWSRSGWGLGAVLDPHALYVVGLVGGDDGLGVQVPALAALRGPQRLGSLGAGWADGGEGVPARDEHLLDLAGVYVGAAELDGTDAAAMGDGQVADDITGERHGQPLRPGLSVGSFGLRLAGGRGRVGVGVGGVPGGAVAAAGAGQGQELGPGAGVEQRPAAVGAVLGR